MYAHDFDSGSLDGPCLRDDRVIRDTEAGRREVEKDVRTVENTSMH